MRKPAILVLLALSAVIAEDGTESKVVEILQGSVKGYKSKDGDFFIFYGIPYATEPKGALKFKAPLPAPVWLNTYEAVEKDIVCPQHKSYKADKVTSENCLVANLYLPNTDDKNLPVHVIFHGGAYQLGSGDLMTPIELIRQKKFLSITFNYRLSIHGFLCLGTEDVPGNAGMKDMVALLRWVKNNIASFGGNPNDVTIDGYSAGSSAVDHIMLSELTKGLFHKVIAESGSAVGVWSTQIDPIQNAKDFAKRFGVDTDDVYVLEEFYKNTPLEELMIDLFLNKTDSTFTFVPCVERKIQEESFLNEAPYNILKNGNLKNIPVLVGFANMEGLFRIDVFYEWKNGMNEKFSDYLPSDLKFSSAEEKEIVAKTVKEFYFGNQPVSEETMQGYIDYFSDILFAYPALRTVKLQVEAGCESIYLYDYAYFDDFTMSIHKRKIENLTVQGAGHCEQTMAVFENPFFDMIAGDEQPENFKKIKAMLHKIWTNFIITGRPVPEGTSELPEWSAMSSNKSPYMYLNLDPELKDNMILERFKLWNDIYDKYYNVPQPPPTPPSRHSEL